MEIQAYGNSEPKYSQFINFAFLISKFSYFQEFAIAFLLKVKIVINEIKNREN